MAPTVHRKRGKQAAGFPAKIKFTPGLTAAGSPYPTVDVAGIRYEDGLNAVLEFDAAGDTYGVELNDHTANASVTNGGGTISMGGTIDAGKGVLVVWYDYMGS